MKLPFVARLEHERALHDVEYWKQETSHLAGNLSRSAEMVDSLTKQLDALKAALLKQMALLEASDARHERDVVRSEARYADMASRYHMLKLQGATLPPVPVSVQVEQDPVTAAVNAACIGNRALRAQMLRQVERDRAAGFKDLEIVTRIQQGTPAEDGVPV